MKESNNEIKNQEEGQFEEIENKKEEEKEKINYKIDYYRENIFNLLTLWFRLVQGPLHLIMEM